MSEASFDALEASHNYIAIENRGEADPLGMRLMGASTKGERQIGRFGTGWKYGIAGALRLLDGLPLFVCVGERILQCSTTEVELRGTKHREVTIDGAPIGVTDQLGKDWEPWMVLREFISNAIDEGHARVYPASEVEPREGTTRVFIPMGPFKEAFDHLEDHFCIDPVPGEVVTDLGRAIPKRDPNVTRIFKKGVLVKRFDRKSAFDYELSDVPIGEDRIAGDIRHSLWKFLDGAPLEVKEAVIQSQFEAESYSYGPASEEWKLAFGDRLVTSRSTGQEGELIVPYQFVEVAERVGARTLRSDKDAKAALRETMPATLTVREACKGLARIGILIDPRIVLMARLEGEDVLVEGGLIYLSKGLSKEGVWENLLLARTASDTRMGSEEHLAALAALVRRLAKQ